MKKTKQKSFACMAILTNNNGFTYLSSITALSLLLILLPFLSFSYQSLYQENTYHELSVRQFFYFLFDEFTLANDYTITDSSITFSYVNREDVLVSRYGSLIRRQVDGKGHEILVRDIKEVMIEEFSGSVRVAIITMEGKEYVKIYNVP